LLSFTPFESRSIFIKPIKLDKASITGMYLFGGLDKEGNAHNDVWLIKPNFEENL
jgi:hypothetical protein